MNFTKIVILALIGISLFARNASAATLTVIRQGTGHGEVWDMTEEAIVCGDDCLQKYPDGATVTLNAGAYDDSIFEGFFVDGTPQSGTFVMKEDITVTAIFEKKPTEAIPEFEIVGSRSSKFNYTKGYYPLYNTAGEIVGAIQGKKHKEKYQAKIIVPKRVNTIIPDISRIVLPTLHFLTLS